MPDRVALTAGAAGSVLVAVGGLGVGAMPRRGGEQQAWLGLDVLRTSTGGRALATALCALGVLALLGAWLALRRSPARAQLVAAGLWSAPLLVAPPLFSRDVYAYAAQGALVHAGLDPYDVGPGALPGPLADSVAAQYAGTPSPYGPVFLALAGRVVALTGDAVPAAVLGLRLLAVAGLVLAAWALHRLGGAPALWLGLANPLVLLHGVGGAHNEALMAGLLVAGLAVGGPGGAVLVALGGLVKAPALAGLALLARPAPLLAAAGTLAASAALGTGWLRTSTQGVDGPSLLSPAYGLGRALQAAGVPHGLGLATVAGTVLGLVLAAVLLLRDRGPRGLGLALVAVAALAPAVQPWYLLWGLLPLAVAARPGDARALAAASAVLCLAVLPSGVPLLQGPTWGAPVLLAALAAAGALAGGRSATMPR